MNQLPVLFSNYSASVPPDSSISKKEEVKKIGLPSCNDKI